MHVKELERALKLLVPMVAEARRKRIASVVESRTNSVAILLENVHDNGNTSAVIRSMDAFGFLNLHVLTTQTNQVEKDHNKKIVRTDAGTRQWINIHEWSDVAECVQHLKEECGYKIASACPNASTPLSEVDFCKKLIVAFGNESKGISDTLSQMSDEHFSIPMCGFVESLNISVSTAITLHQAYSYRFKKLKSNGDLNEEEKQRLTLQYYVKSIGTNNLMEVLSKHESVVSNS